MPHVTELNHPEQLESYRLIWQALWGETRGASLFQTLDWLRAYWGHCGARQRLRVLVVSSDGTPVGILPLSVANERTRIGRLRTLSYPLGDCGSFFGPIGPNPMATLIAAMRHLAETPRDWDLFDLRSVDRDGLDLGRTRRSMQWAGFQGRERVWKECGRIEITGTWDDYLATRSSRFRNDLRRCWKRVYASGDVRYVHHRPENSMSGDGRPRWDLYDDCLQVAKRSWQGRSTTGNTLSHAEVARFFRQAHAVAAKHGMLDMHLMYHGERPVAFTYNYHCQGNVIGMRTGYDPELSSLGLGKVLLAHTFRTCMELGDRAIDLGPDYLAAKRPWLTRIARSYRYTHYPLAAPRAQLLRLKRWLTDAVPLPA